jgi:hypothetical protein
MKYSLSAVVYTLREFLLFDPIKFFLLLNTIFCVRDKSWSYNANLNDVDGGARNAGEAGMRERGKETKVK